MKGWAKLVLLALAAIVAVELAWKGMRRQPVKLQGPGQPAPALALPDLQGKEVDLAQYRGKVVAVNFWATWCPPCREEIPDLARVWREHKDRCFELLGVAEESARSDVTAMARSLPYPVLFDADASLLVPWNVRGYPKTFVIDVEGNVRQVFSGEIDDRTLTDAITPLLPPSCPGGQG
ncbi:MAG: TlpA disulfide reductase family protein [Anaeromyxobacter sp.]